MPDPILVTEHLTLGYSQSRRPARIVTEDVNATLLPGELVCLLGPNGAGKSTLLRTLAGMQSPLGGSVRLMGEDVFRLDARELARRMSIVLTERVSAGSLSAYALVALGRHPYTDWTGRLRDEDEQIVRWAIDAVQARPLAGRSVAELSDGERQKIMIARALAQQPALMLLDEPTAFLDLPHRVEVMHILRQLAHEGGQAILLSTHDLDLALRHADRIWLLPPGGPLQVGAPEDLVLSGAFARTFTTSGLTFDLDSGSFSVVDGGARRIGLHGSGPQTTWTRRALEREGYHVTADAPDGRPPWKCWTATTARSGAVCPPSSSATLRSIYDLVCHLRALEATPRPAASRGLVGSLSVQHVTLIKCQLAPKPL